MEKKGTGRKFLTAFATVSACLALLLLWPVEPAWAWGPGAHMVTSSWLLQELGGLALPVGELLARYPRQFVHGVLSADIFIGKGCKAKPGHSHNWESGFQLLGRASSGYELSFAYGYLCHLAADTVAHNVFVPGLLHTLPHSGKLGHVYLETQADRILIWKSSTALKALRGRSGRSASRMLAGTMRQKRLSYWLKKSLYKGSISLGAAGWWRRSMHMVDGMVPERDRGDLLDEMLTVSAAAMLDVLRHAEGSTVCRLDPIGAAWLDHTGAAGQAVGRTRGLKASFRKKQSARPELGVPLPAELADLALKGIPAEWSVRAAIVKHDGRVLQ